MFALHLLALLLVVAVLATLGRFFQRGSVSRERYPRTWALLDAPRRRFGLTWGRVDGFPVSVDPTQLVLSLPAGSALLDRLAGSREAAGLFVFALDVGTADGDEIRSALDAPDAAARLSKLLTYTTVVARDGRAALLREALSEATLRAAAELGLKLIARGPAPPATSRRRPTVMTLLVEKHLVTLTLKAPMTDELTREALTFVVRAARDLTADAAPGRAWRPEASSIFATVVVVGAMSVMPGIAVYGIERSGIARGVEGRIVDRGVTVYHKSREPYLIVETRRGRVRTVVPADAWRHCARGEFRRAPYSLTVRCNGATFTHAGMACTFAFVGLVVVFAGVVLSGVADFVYRRWTLAPRRRATHLS